MKNTLSLILAMVMTFTVVPLMNFVEGLTSRVWFSICGLVSLMFVGASAQAAGVSITGAEGINLPQFILVLWQMKSELPWQELVPLVAFALIPVASVFTSITATPKPGTLWSSVYWLIEKAALKFWKSKDKFVDTEVRQLTGKPLDLNSDAAMVVANELRGVMVGEIQKKLNTGLISKLPMFVQKIFF